MKNFFILILLFFFTFYNFYAQSLAEHKVAIILIDHTGGDPEVDLPSLEMMNQILFDLTAKGSVASLYNEMSYQKTAFIGDLYGWYNIAPPVDGTSVAEWKEMVWQYVYNLQNTEGINFSNYDDIFLIRNSEQGILSTGGATSQTGNPFVQELGINIGRGQVGITSANFRDPDRDDFIEKIINNSNPWYGGAHELLHLYGFGHDGSINCDSNVFPVNEECLASFTGNYFSIMSNNEYSNHISPSLKASVNWFNNSQIKNIVSGYGKLFPYEKIDNKLKTIKIDLPNTFQITFGTNNIVGTVTALYLEFRTFIGFDKKFKSLYSDVNRNGVLVTAEVELGLGHKTNILLDMTPSTGNDDLKDAFLYNHHVFSIPNNSIEIKVTRVCPNQFAEININLTAIKPKDELLYIDDLNLNPLKREVALENGITAEIFEGGDYNLQLKNPDIKRIRINDTEIFNSERKIEKFKGVIKEINYQENNFLFADFKDGSSTHNVFLKKQKINPCIYQPALTPTKIVDQKILIYPQPSSGLFNIKLNKENIYQKLVIYDMLGNIYYKTDISNQSLISIDLKDVKKGIYLIKFFDVKRAVLTKKIFIE
ncbi:T9SS type A sorting domain-containing protein [uncultured Polaribacter sp.]|uniref:T9SS type A sorting domain-containing protein n=1 Tax=uncultured Polaribacter sp. TaxID=174711 RepID=UPI0026044648|nr:T9SS type A sorting domain-containing protein [uncultured Polaribacter sp.]